MTKRAWRRALFPREAPLPGPISPPDPRLPPNTRPLSSGYRRVRLTLRTSHPAPLPRKIPAAGVVKSARRAVYRVMRANRETLEERGFVDAAAVPAARDE
jgi:hypothetical protein